MNWIKQNWIRVAVGMIILSVSFFAFSTWNGFLKNNLNKIPIIIPPTSSLESLPLDEKISSERLTDSSVMLDEHRPQKFKSSDAGMIRNAISKNAFLRDFISLKGVSGVIALYVLNPSLNFEPLELNNGVLSFFWSCNNEDFGQTITGTYKLALVREGKIINDVEIPFSDYNNWPRYTFEKPDPDGASGYIKINDAKGVWKNEGELTFRHAQCIIDKTYEENLDACSGSGLNFFETKQLMPVDLTGDGLSHEFKFMTEYLSCGNRKYVIAGYNKAVDRVIVYPVVDDYGEYPNYDDFNPRADGTATYDSGCDHWAERHNIKQFKFSNKLKKYVQYDSTGTITCD